MNSRAGPVRRKNNRSSVRSETSERLGLRTLPVLIFAAFASLAFLVYAPSLSGPLIFDDLTAFPSGDRPPPWPSWQQWLRPHSRPVTMASFWITGRWLASPTLGHKVGNVLIHAANGLLLFLLIRRLLAADSRNQVAVNSRTMVSRFALTVSALWIVHPLASQSVAYVIQRSEALMTMFFLWLMLVTARAGPASGWRALVVALLFALGIGCKTVMITALAVVPLMHRSFLYHSWKETIRNQWPVYLPPILAGVLATAALLPVLVKQNTAVGIGEGTPHPSVYLMTQAKVLVEYAQLAVLPWQLSIDRSPRFVTSPVEGVAYASLTAAWLASAVWLWKSLEQSRWRKPIAFLMIAPLIVLSPTSSIIPTADPFVEHRMYFPLAFLITLGGSLVAWVYQAILSRIKPTSIPVARFCFAGIGLALVLSLAARTYARAADYSSSSAIWYSAVLVDPENPRAVQNLLAARQREGVATEIEQEFAVLIDKLGRQGDPVDEVAHYLGVYLTSRGRLRQAIPILESVAMKTPSEEKLLIARQRRAASSRYVNLAIAYQQSGQNKAAARAMAEALRYDDTAAYAFAIAGQIALELGRTDSAKRYWERAIDLNPEPWPELERRLETLRQALDPAR